ncbi:tetratricopeptide repeat protein [Flagellimonas marina]|uniref:Tetratricopeptide repeat protein n=1 Tax=Flagellimonas marina TaxID=1775168 RepID=A0ABV8PPB6_9FLAO
MRFPPFFSLLLLVFLFAIQTGSAQTKKIDSLQNLLKTASDTTEVNLLNSLGVNLRSFDKEKALDLFEESIAKSKEIGYLEGETQALYSIGLTYGMTGDYVESLDYLNQCLVMAKQHEDYERINFIYNAMGIVYKRIGDYPKSQSYYLKRIKLVDSLQLDQNLSSPYINLGVLYSLMGEHDKAIESYEMALETYKGPDRKSLENNVLYNLGEIDFEKGNYEAALDKLLRATTYLEKVNNNIELCSLYLNIGNCYQELGQWKLAQDYYIRSLALAEQLSIKQEIARIQSGLANLMFLQKRYDEAMTYSNESLGALDSLSGYKLKHDAHEIAYKIYEARGQYTKAIHHLSQSIAYKDSLLNETKIKEIQNLQIQHDVYLKDREIKENELQLELLNTSVSLNNKRMVYLSIILVLLLFSAGLLYFRYLNKKKSNRILHEKNNLISQQKEVIERMNSQLEKRMLRAQMNPHFIFNSLSSIRYLVSSGDKEAALTYLNKFSKLLRQVLETSVNVSLVLHEEIELLKIYVELEALRFDNSFSYSFNIDENLDLHQHEVPMLLVQPYIENAILHGLLPKEGPKKLSVSFKDKMNHIESIIEDNGVGFDSSKNQRNTREKSRGMSITAKRIEVLKKFSNEELVKIENLNEGKETGTRVTILIPKE